MTDIRERAIRNFLAVVLMSNMTRKEVLEMAQLLDQGRLAEDIAELLRESFSQVSFKKADKSSNIKNASRDKLDAEIIIREVIKRRVSKKALADLMQQVAPSLRLQDISLSITIKGLVSRFLKDASINEAATLLNVLRGTPADPFVRGIAKRG